MYPATVFNEMKNKNKERGMIRATPSSHIENPSGGERT
jgi:hypothetical protein